MSEPSSISKEAVEAATNRTSAWVLPMLYSPHHAKHAEERLRSEFQSAIDAATAPWKGIAKANLAALEEARDRIRELEASLDDQVRAMGNTVEKETKLYRRIRELEATIERYSELEDVRDLEANEEQ